MPMNRSVAYSATVLPLALGLGHAYAAHPPAETAPTRESSAPTAPTAHRARASNARGGGAGKMFSVPIGDLARWSHDLVTTFDNVTITGHSSVHPLKSDCEMHFGASVPSYKGRPDGFVLEPMNLCVQPFFGKTKYAKADWIKLGDSLTSRTARVRGVPRIWPEHLTGQESDSNPNHALELHPLLELESDGQKYSFADFVFAPDGFEGGVREATAANILQQTTVSVRARGDQAEVSFEAGTIGNFTTLTIAMRDKADAVDGGHRVDGDVLFGGSETVPVRLASTAGSDADAFVSKLNGRTGHEVQALVLLSLSPEALSDAAVRSQAQRQAITLSPEERPIQLIVYGIDEGGE